MAPMVNSPTFADVVFYVPSQKDKSKESIYGHAWLLEFRSSEFYAPLAFTAKKKKHMTEIDITGITPHYFIELLTYIYTSHIDIEHYSLNELMDFYSGIQQFEDKTIERLKWLIQTKIRTSTNMENIHALLKKSTDLKLTVMKNFFFVFCL